MGKKIVILEKLSVAKNAPAHPPAGRKSGSSQPNGDQTLTIACIAIAMAGLGILIAIIAAAAGS